MPTIIRSHDLSQAPHKEIDYVDILEGHYYAGDAGYASVAIARGDFVLALVGMALEDETTPGMCFYEFSPREFRAMYPERVLVLETYMETNAEIRPS